MSRTQTRARAPLATGALVLALAAAPALAVPAMASPAPAQAAPASPSQGGWDGQAYRGKVDVVPAADEDQDTLDGVVFDDKDKDSEQDDGEPGIKGVTVSNGREVVTTDSKGRYELPARDNMNVFVTQPAGYQVPVDRDNVAQFSYIHMPEGSPDLKYGGVEPTGPLPGAVNFPMAKSQETRSPHQSCIIGGDVQTYDRQEVEYARAGAFTDLAERSDYTGCGALFLGDIVGDDLSLYPETRGLTSMINGPARFLPGNHDLDLDAVQSSHRFDTFRSQLGPDYYSYDVGTLHVVALNSVQYRKGDQYFGGLGEEQLEWLRRDIAQVPKDTTIVLASHIPLLNYNDQSEKRHQVKEVQQVHDIVAGHEAVSFAGHSHTTEFMRAGDSAAGWAETMGVAELPFDHITAGAIAGDWYSGRVDDGYPTALQKDGAKPGVVTFESRPDGYSERFTVTGGDESEQMAVGVNSPRYREWVEKNRENAGSAPGLTDPTSITRADLAAGTWLTADVFAGSTGTEVTVSIDGGEAKEAERTQPMQGEEKKLGPLWSDPVAVQEQLVHGGNLAESGMHLWRHELPGDLAVGTHTAEVTSTDRYGRTCTETIELTVTE